MADITKSLDFARDFKTVEDARVVVSPDEIKWDHEADLVIAGTGGAGITAALRGMELGLDVITLDRFEGGGSTAMNGGIYYAGGGTRIQKEAGVEDTAEEMYKYLALETKGVVKEETLRRFCETSAQVLDWLMGHGVEFNSTAYLKKTSYPYRGYYLYHPDNSLLSSYAKQARPAARGHKAFLDLGDVAQGFGRALYKPLEAAAVRFGARIFTLSSVSGLILDKSGKVLGVKVVRVPASHPERETLLKYQRLATKYQLILPPQVPGAQATIALGHYYDRKARRIEKRATVVEHIRARYGVCLSTGGFIQNKAMLAHYAPAHLKTMPNGSLGDDGSGILLGLSAGARLSRMDRVSSWRFLNPPAAWAKGMLVNAKGARYVDEAAYGATIGEEMMRPGNDGVAQLILDQTLYEAAWAEVKTAKLLPFQRDPARMTMWFFKKKAPTLSELAAKMGFDQATFLETARAYNAAAEGREPDKLEKGQEDMQPLVRAPFYAVNLSIDSPFFPLPAITVGGLAVHEETGAVLRDDGRPVDNLYAAGRTAVGICSNLYVSGLSAADCIFSGRRVAEHVSTLKQRRAVA